MEPFIGQIIMFGGNFAPRGWAFCNGQLLAISQNTALFSILGDTYGGDGRTTFGLPELRGRSPVHVGGINEAGPGLPPVTLGERAGQTTTTLKVSKISLRIHIPLKQLRYCTEHRQGPIPPTCKVTCLLAVPPTPRQMQTRCVQWLRKLLERKPR